MVAVDPSLKGRKLILRKSMVKFECETSEALEVIKISEERMLSLRGACGISDEQSVNQAVDRISSVVFFSRKRDAQPANHYDFGTTWRTSRCFPALSGGSR